MILELNRNNFKIQTLIIVNGSVIIITESVFNFLQNF